MTWQHRGVRSLPPETGSGGGDRRADHVRRNPRGPLQAPPPNGTRLPGTNVYQACSRPPPTLGHHALPRVPASRRHLPGLTGHLRSGSTTTDPPSWVESIRASTPEKHRRRAQLSGPPGPLVPVPDAVDPPESPLHPARLRPTVRPPDRWRLTTTPPPQVTLARYSLDRQGAVREISDSPRERPEHCTRHGSDRQFLHGGRATRVEVKAGPASPATENVPVVISVRGRTCPRR